MGDHVSACDRFVAVTAALVALSVSAGCGLLPDTYVFEPEDLEQIAAQVNAASGEDAVAQATQLLEAQGYPVRTSPTWVFNGGAGIPGQTAAVYLYANEYLLFAGPVAGEQWSMGPYFGADIYDYVLYGDLLAYSADDLNPPSLGPGDDVFLGTGYALQYRTTGGVWIMEYGRGLLPAELYSSAFASEYPLAQNLFLFGTGSFVTSFIRNYVYEAIGLPGGIFSLFGM